VIRTNVTYILTSKIFYLEKLPPYVAKMSSKLKIGLYSSFAQKYLTVLRRLGDALDEIDELTKKSGRLRLNVGNTRT